MNRYLFWSTNLAVEQFAKALVARGGDPHHIKWVAIDMRHCYAKRVREQFPATQIVYDAII
jgi:transposase